jgi:hypothetical protein
MTAYWVSIILTVVCFFSSCKRRASESGDLQELARDKTAKNVVLIINAFEKHDSILRLASEKDADGFESLFKNELAGQNFEVIRSDDTTLDKARSLIENASSMVNQNGTLILIHSSHGATNGSVAMVGGKFYTYKDLVQDLAANRKEPMGRLAVFINACYSGTAIKATPTSNIYIGKELTDFVRQFNSFTSDHSPHLWIDPARAELAGRKSSPALFRQLITFTSSTAQEVSWSGQDGSQFYREMIKSIKNLSASDPEGATFHDLITEVQQKLAQSKLGALAQKPVLYSFPKTLAQNMRLFSKDTSTLPIKVSPEQVKREWLAETLEALNERLSQTLYKCVARWEDTSSGPGSSPYFYGLEATIESSQGKIERVFMGSSHHWLSYPDFAAKAMKDIISNKNVSKSAFDVCYGKQGPRG